jgi:hypothetical protein
MGTDILTEIRAAGITLSVDGGNLVATPKAAITDDIRTLIRFIVTAEPWLKSAVLELEAWCEARGWDWRLVPGGMWNPPSTVLYLLAPPKNGGNVEAAASAYRLHPPKEEQI